jgi:hypothetical protein
MEEDPTEGQPPRFSSRAQRDWAFISPSSHSKGSGASPRWTAGGRCPSVRFDQAGSRMPLKVRGQKRGVAMRGNWHENLRHGQYPIKSVGEGNGEFRSQKVDVQLKITRAVHAVHDE